MSEGLTFGYRIIKLDEVASTNSYAHNLAVETNLIEGLVVLAKNQTEGKGQRGNIWQVESGKNLTFSLVLKPNLAVSEQFMLSKVVALGIADFLASLNLEQVNIKWPNDIWVNNKKIAGILIENTLKSNKISTSIVGVGLNVNQQVFNSNLNATSLQNELSINFDIEILLNDLLICLEKRYLMLRALQYQKINTDYLNNLLGYNTELNYKIGENHCKGIIRGVNPLGLLQLEIEGQLNEFDLKEVSLIGV
ncbi:biotin--[acetyl-CoA-carboxylase] ligase [Vicingus serpentipes]|uniref:Biotin--[acetyl-CoA-carboxylase] ligase n=1 Tax=Vicingus serpentipes TaxID=1926625 RepID=A0A5C6RSZ8_9FLAO|nr:biotin--[acetyl-CoA-carboxylase] ligase [Vicingus serpentipes]TXB65471.1 biotin--[acetyl-CoA-carboxylase] ligase [Vicingus serpentipes]